MPLVALAAGAVRHAGRGAPALGRDEGALVAASWATGRSLPATARTFSPVDASPATWLLAGWDRATGAFAGAPGAALGGRSAMAVALAVTVVLVWVVARRLGLARWAAAAALAVAGFSPLAAGLHGTVQPGALAAPWLLGAVALARGATVASRRTAGWAGAGVALAVATLTCSAIAVTAPALAWQVWRAARPSARRRALTAFASGWVAALAIGWLAAGRTTSWVPDLGLGALGGELGRALPETLSADVPTVVVLAVAAVLAPWATRRLRPVGLAFWSLAAATLLPDVPAVVVLTSMVPLGAVLLGGALEVLWTWTLDVRRSRRATTYNASRGVEVLDAAAPAALGLLVVVGAVALVHWTGDHAADATATGGGEPAADAVAWLDANVDDGPTVVVDDRLWLDVVLAGTAPEDVAPVPGPGGRLRADASRDYVLLGPGPSTEERTTFGSSPAVAVFSTGATLVEVRRLGDPVPEATDVDPVAAGGAVAGNPRVDLGPEAEALLRAGRVDERVLTVLTTVAIDHRIEIGGFVVDPAEDAAGAPVRSVDVVALDDRPITGTDATVAEVLTFLEAQDRPWYRPGGAEIVAGLGGVPTLRITFPPM